MRFRACITSKCLVCLKGVALLLSTVLSAPGMSGENVGENVAEVVLSSRFYRTAAYVQGSSEALRSDFAVVALGLLAEAYRAEAEIARKDALADGEQAALIAWADAVERYSYQFAQLLEDVDLGFPVSLTVRPQEPVAIAVADRVLILTHPRLVHQASFEQRVLQSFCSRQSCEQILAEPAQDRPMAEQPNRVRPLWSFSSDGPVCKYGGIELHFSGAAELSSARPRCAAVMREVVTLAAEIAWQVRYGVVVDWAALELFETPGRSGHRLQLNAQGDAVLAAAPVLFRSPKLLQRMVGWIRARVERRAPPGLVLHADDFGGFADDPGSSERE